MRLAVALVGCSLLAACGLNGDARGCRSNADCLVGTCQMNPTCGGAAPPTCDSMPCLDGQVCIEGADRCGGAACRIACGATSCLDDERCEDDVCRVLRCDDDDVACPVDRSCDPTSPTADRQGCAIDACTVAEDCSTLNCLPDGTCGGPVGHCAVFPEPQPP